MYRRVAHGPWRALRGAACGPRWGRGSSPPRSAPCLVAYCNDPVRRDYRVPGARRPPERPGPPARRGTRIHRGRPSTGRGACDPRSAVRRNPRRLKATPELAAEMRATRRAEGYCSLRTKNRTGERRTRHQLSRELHVSFREPLRLTPTTPKARTHSTTTTQRPPTWQGRKMRHLRVQRVHPCAHLPPTRGTNTQTHTRSPQSAKRSRMVCARPHTVCRPCLPLASAPRQATGFRLLPLSKEQEESGFAAGAHTRRRRRGGRHGDGVGPRWAPVGGHGGEWRGEVGWWKQTDGRARARGTPSPRTRLIGDTLLPERNRTTAAINTAAVRPLAVSALRGGWGGWRGA